MDCGNGGVGVCIGLWELSELVCLSSLCVSIFKTSPDSVLFCFVFCF